ncbi:MAG: LD-carboxypeptidase [Spirochaetaceae bacterium]|jgi:muramoyltetrapeptide carboxypeptidase LdcA involved in peptidoglycan recycling|nr:LD-carboxypeptidase [Spirochaetaceae bacterium]
MDANKLFMNPQLRAEDINNAFSDQNIHGIISTIGGDDSVRILKYLNINKIKQNPKFIMGYSDFTTISTYLNLNGLVTFNGPSIMAGFSQFLSFTKEYRRYIEDYLFSPKENSIIPEFSSYSDGYPDWINKKNIGKVNSLKKNDGVHFIQGSGKCSGQLFGGCIDVLEMMKGTAFWPTKDFWKNKILFLETSEEKPSIDCVKYWLRNYGVMGVFEQISAILFGRAREYSIEEKEKLEEAIISVVKEEFGNSQLAIITNLDFGHTDPQIILPLGINIEIDISNKKIFQTESAFK